MVDRRHNTEIHQFFDNLSRLDGHLLSQITYCDVLGDIDVINNFFGWLLKGMLVRLIRQLLASASPSSGHTCLGRRQVINGQVMPSLLASRTRHSTALEATLTRSTPQLIALGCTTLFGRRRVQSLGLFV